MSIELSEGNLKSLGVFNTILGIMISLDISAYFHLEQLCL